MKKIILTLSIVLMTTFSHADEALRRAIMRECKVKNLDNLAEMPDEHLEAINEASMQNDIPRPLLVKIVDTESGFVDTYNPRTKAKGYCGIMPNTFQHYAQRLGLTKHTPVANIKVGAAYLKDLFTFWKRRGLTRQKAWEMAISDYLYGRSRVTERTTGGRIYFNLNKGTTRPMRVLLAYV